MKIEKAFNYRCDRCRKEISSKDKITIFVQKTRVGNPKKEFDLCKQCYLAMEKGIQKGKR